MHNNVRTNDLFQSIVYAVVNRPPLADLGLLLALFPLWWFLGVEQFIWVIGAIFICIKVVYLKQQTITIVPTVSLFFLFLVIYLISGLFIVEPFRLITFARNFGSYVAAFLVLLIITNQVANWVEIRQLLMAMAVVVFITTVIGLMGILDLWRPTFPSLMGTLLPAWIRNTSYGGQISFRSTGNMSWFTGLNSYFRVYAFFLYSTLYASTLALFLPMVIFLFGQASKLIIRLFLVTLAALIIVNLVYTTGRIAILGCLVGAAYYLIFYSKLRIVIRLLLILLVIGSAVILFVQAFSSTAVFDPITQLFEQAVFARGQGSFLSRSQVYRLTLQGVLERPFFGWGTERDISDSVFPAGSHSHYLGVLYKQGIIGFVVFVGIYISVWQATAIPKLQNAASSQQNTLLKLLKFGRWTLIAVLVNSMTDVLDLDATTLLFLWVILALLIQARTLIGSPADLQPATVIDGTPA